MAEYAVVEFVHENAVEVVHNSWIENTSEGLYSYWPTSGASQKARKGELPDKQRWQKFEVRMFSYTASHEKALRNAKQAENTSKMQSEEEQSIRKRKKPHRFIASSSESEKGDG
ncbi:PREDICTED: uncharacterized protein LOC106811046 [Priapulus caudatus]|uniref:Uncharacterized protein LOC106811046 n=1 Tax=Priapulus caudatus TaxID=37621 RepID=A0ABM1ECY1_PRICU|nr:PREDICTED: uncharacterized protein LOC106811046 [Priapulus caudatus]